MPAAGAGKPGVTVFVLLLLRLLYGSVPTPARTGRD